MYAPRQWGKHKTSNGKTKLVDRVLHSIRGTPGTVREICEDIGLPVERAYINQVSGVISDLVR